MKYLKINYQKSRAQAIVEFAIVLPLLLLVLYGIIETGRFLFIYSSVVTASRQAARYGSATGQGINNAVPRYQDCGGIRAAANAAAYINKIDNSEIVIGYDAGPGAPLIPYCIGGVTTDSSLTSATLSDNKHRIVVTINEAYSPIVPRIVPFAPDTIRATSSRTVILSVSIVSTPPFTPTFTFTPTLTPSTTPTQTLTFTPSRTPTITPTLQFTYTPSRTPTATLPSTATRTPTTSPVPPTALASCNVTPGLLMQSGNTLTMTINNSTGANLEIKNVTFQWNHDKGHQAGSDKTLILQSARLGSTTFWTGNNIGPSTNPPIIPSPAVSIPTGTSTIVFTFHQSFDYWDNTEIVEIQLLNPGCLLPISQAQH
jgi:Flp pilus assembly protein TadG